MAQFNGQPADYCNDCRTITPLHDLWRNEATGFTTCGDCIRRYGRCAPPPLAGGTTKAARNIARSVK